MFMETLHDVSTVSRCVNRDNGRPEEKGGTDLNDQPHRGKLTAAVNEDDAKQSDADITVYRRITIAKICVKAFR